MRITNKTGLPEPFARAASAFARKYPPSIEKISVTELIDSPRIRELRYRHWDELEEDVADRVWALFGQSIHAILERGAPEEALSEERLYLYRRIGEKVIRLGGSPDLYHEERVQDFKVTSAWTLVFGDRVIEWERQQNLYAHMLRQNKLVVRGLEIVAILKDWSERKASEDAKYPQGPIQVIPLRLWPDEEVERYLMERLRIHVAATEELPLCTPRERWEKNEKWAVHRRLRDGGISKSAVRLLDTESEAEKYIAMHKNSNDLIISHRPGEPVRCKSYCAVSEFCDQWRAERESST